MSKELISSPFGAEDLPRVHLDRAPLVRVVAQLKYPSLAVLRGDSVADKFAAHFGKEYPVVEDQRGVNFLITPTGLTQQQSDQRIWSFRSGDDKWKLTLAENFLALDTENYPKRRDFISRFEDAVKKIIELANPPYFERLGLRYLNRIADLDLINGRLKNMVRAEMQGALATDRPQGVELRHAMFDSLFIEGEHGIQLRSGILPRGRQCLAWRSLRWKRAAGCSILIRM